ncbi:hypothetical protein GUJ93_ZPchr0012g19379 [Zizania palustris]|uniref:Uncharacterized protein n=1 Tax=Zizania palustris TaxID=103762 RepID=A0A8J5WIX8_ZIZPA|nr:hypothetical protein GUJ93_ZPchr0012g19379 [Zizania palustris]
MTITIGSDRIDVYVEPRAHNTDTWSPAGPTCVPAYGLPAPSQEDTWRRATGHDAAPSCFFKKWQSSAVLLLLTRTAAAAAAIVAGGECCRVVRVADSRASYCPPPPAARVGARRHMRISVPAGITCRRRATEEAGNIEASARCHLLPRRRPLLPTATCCLIGARPTPSTPRASRLVG